jgi:tetratricopeptide (TPR) repeat protein
MIRGLPIALLGFVSGICSAATNGSGWAVAGAPWRVALHAVSPPDAPQAGWEIRLPDFGAGRLDMRDVVLLGADGKEIALDGVWRGSGRSLLMLAESMPAEGAAAMLYIGGNSSRRMKSWSAERSLLLETRRMPAGAKIASFSGWQDAWKKSPAVDGAAFVPLIFHGGNPFGGEARYISRYTGLIKTGDGGEMKFYTLSDDVSYVRIDGRPVLDWRQNHPPPLDPTKVPLADVRVEKGFAKVEYCHAAVDAPGAMVLGWNQGGKLGNVPPEAWAHPGRVKADAFESADGAPVPSCELEAESYVGYAGEWYVRVKAAIAAPGDGWQVEWLWPDGRVDKGNEVRRLWMSLDPVKVVLRLRKGARMIEGRRVLMIPRDMNAASVNNDGQMVGFLELLEKEDAATLPEPARKAGFLLARDFLPPVDAARWAEAWLAKAKPGGEAWARAMELALRENARNDPRAALARIDGLSAEARKAMGRDADLLELDIRVFGLKDPLVVGLASKLGKSGDKLLARMALVRLGDYHLLNGRIEEAARCFSQAVAADKNAARQAPVIDRAQSMVIEELVNGGHLDEARARLGEWERARPAAKIEGDQLLWRARVMFLAGDYGRALQDLETSLRVRPGSPEEIEVLFWQGRALYELGRKDQAREVWKTLMKDYPKHERAEAARQWSEKP